MSDVDVYRVEMPHKGRIEAELTDLPEDYDLTLLGGKAERSRCRRTPGPPAS